MSPPDTPALPQRSVRAIYDEIRELFDEVATVDWRNPVWSGFAMALATSERVGQRELSAARAAESFVLALQANSAMSADTFMACDVAVLPRDRAARVRQLAARARATARALASLDRVAPDQRLLLALRLDDGWLRPVELDGVPLAFTCGERACIGRLSPDADDAWLEPAIEAMLDGRSHESLTPIDPADARPTPAVAVVALEPVSLVWARSFHRRAWTRGGGPWTGVADCAPYAVVSTCHAAIDGYLHARFTAAVLEAEVTAPEGGPSPVAAPSDGPTPPDVGFATCIVRDEGGARVRFAPALHAFVEALDQRLGTDPTRSVPIHVPIAPGHRTDSARWRRRPLYGLLALPREPDGLEPLERFSARLPEFLAREAAGRGILTRVLRAALEMPLSVGARRRLIMRQPWTDRFVPPAQILTGAGYFSWMRFAQEELPPVATYPSAVPSFAADRGGAGLSIAHCAEGLAVGLTTSGSLGTNGAAQSLLDDWRRALAAGRGSSGAASGSSLGS